MLVDITQSDLEGNDIPAEAGPTQQATANFGAEVARPRAALQAQDAPDAAKAFQALSTSMASPKFSFGSRAKGRQSRPKAPGPGSYMDPSADLNSRHKRLPRFGFGTDTRLVKLVNRTPGPGSYSVTMVLGSDANKVSCTPRREVKQTKPRQKARNLGIFLCMKQRSAVTCPSCRLLAYQGVEWEILLDASGGGMQGFAMQDSQSQQPLEMEYRRIAAECVRASSMTTHQIGRISTWGAGQVALTRQAGASKRASCAWKHICRPRPSNLSGVSSSPI
ncbi:nsa2 [Symbiodinium necroappetens]|uniref:Nsa2 protein n=1 Tax=Symbiodinium necroappetens TaxID=1628268 RepID=A0A812LA73_9DINO|nr:nsa2 [Symbiodinium necroappetens]